MSIRLLTSAATSHPCFFGSSQCIIFVFLFLLGRIGLDGWMYIVFLFDPFLSTLLCITRIFQLYTLLELHTIEHYTILSQILFRLQMFNCRKQMIAVTFTRRIIRLAFTLRQLRSPRRTLTSLERSSLPKNSVLLIKCSWTGSATAWIYQRKHALN